MTDSTRIGEDTRPDFDKLRDKARAMIDNRELPATIPKSVIADDYTQGNCKCRICGVHLKRFGDFRYCIFDYVPDYVPDKALEYILCFRCHAAWQVAVITRFK